MVKKPAKTNGLKGDIKLKHVLPKYERSRPEVGRSSKQRQVRHEEVIPKPDEEFRLKKDVREDEPPAPRSRFRRKEPYKQVEIQPQPATYSGITALKLIVIVIGIIILISSMAIAYQNRTEEPETEDESLKKEGYHFMEELLESQELCYDNPPQHGIFSGHKVEYVTAEDLEQDLQPEFNFYIEIIDESDYAVKYTRSEGSGNAISSTTLNDIPERILPNDSIPYNHYDSGGSEVFLLNSYVTIRISDMEVHPAKLTVIIWS